MINSRWPRPIGTMESIDFRPVCIGCEQVDDDRRRIGIATCPLDAGPRCSGDDRHADLVRLGADVKMPDLPTH